jgi:hypothetical protein
MNLIKSFPVAVLGAFAAVRIVTTFWCTMGHGEGAPYASASGVTCASKMLHHLDPVPKQETCVCVRVCVCVCV